MTSNRADDRLFLVKTMARNIDVDFVIEGYQVFWYYNLQLYYMVYNIYIYKLYLQLTN